MLTSILSKSMLTNSTYLQKFHRAFFNIDFFKKIDVNRAMLNLYFIVVYTLAKANIKLQLQIVND